MQLEEMRFELTRPLLVIKAPKGFLACAYISLDTCNKLDEACAIVSGVSDYEDMKKASIIAVSERAAVLGIQVGDTGLSALQKFQ